ncbi:MAG: hypothetical protein OXC94_08160 [Chloroflexi bacterium]|nr:hypothetical protein [Chloroflexota bacterium]
MRRCSEHTCCLTFDLTVDGGRIVGQLHRSVLPDVWNTAAMLGY